MFSIFVTNKEENEFKLAGQTNSNSPANLSAVARKITRETPTNLRRGEISTATTKNFHVDLIEKEDSRDLIVRPKPKTNGALPE